MSAFILATEAAMEWPEAFAKAVVFGSLFVSTAAVVCVWLWKGGRP
jgi:hypothetical protein